MALLYFLTASLKRLNRLLPAQAGYSPHKIFPLELYGENKKLPRIYPVMALILKFYFLFPRFIPKIVYTTMYTVYRGWGFK